jgi:AraC-like DNA-binding protein
LISGIYDTNLGKEAFRNDLKLRQQIIGDALKEFTGLSESNLDHYPMEVQEMLEYIRKHLFEKNLTIEKMKRDCRLTNNNVTTMFRQTVGSGARKYIISQRLKVAAMVLHAMDVNVYLVAAAIGYSEEAFSRLFKKNYGCTPCYYRKMVLREGGRRTR